MLYNQPKPVVIPAAEDRSRKQSQEIHVQRKSLLITGGTGSFGKQYVHTILTSYQPKKPIIYSRDEIKVI